MFIVKRKLTIFWLAGTAALFIAAISFAAILGYYLKMQGTAEVKRPHFYIGSAIPEVLLVDEKPDDCSHFYIENSQTRAFITEEDFKGIDFDYVPQALFSVRAKVESINGTTTPQSLHLKFGYINLDGQAATVCSASVLLNDAMSDYILSPVQCSAKPRNVRRFFYEMTGDCTDCRYTVSKCAGDFHTKVELDKQHE